MSTTQQARPTRLDRPASVTDALLARLFRAAGSTPPL